MQTILFRHSSFKKQTGKDVFLVTKLKSHLWKIKFSKSVILIPSRKQIMFYWIIYLFPTSQAANEKVKPFFSLENFEFWITPTPKTLAKDGIIKIFLQYKWVFCGFFLGKLFYM